ncbi:putative P-loop containing nucleoside triphosphate hydrolase, leucine-rich repeat domain, L [Rosa chinensis]|uniref:Putative P-loop containing nucleoside triphosphate hydrolase, leucine-rich repeat domain, L n=1 Tax=Rosa chinensis TaxID=74649 RepID=A0A2P6PPD6_ROSCH|nr:probable disease resistance protein At1g58602 [Rosa chinensis]PRQ23776.1 putative P-loop containing nucleoside triphosphate hydrolase, leucine-rich repeat domain, L [Rosa chinensis]
MAELVVSGVAKSLADLLKDVLVEESKPLLRVRQNVRDIQKELTLINCVLKDADEKQGQDNSLQNWVSDIREIAYDAEDVIRTFSIRHVMRISKPVKWYAWLNLGQLRHRCKVGSEIKAIKAEISRLRISSQTYNLISVGQGPSSNALDDRQQYSHENEDIVGFESSINEIVDDLVDDSRPGWVVSIWGMAGIGKTTLARELYRNGRIRHHFDGFGWVCISQQFKPEDAWEQVLFNLVAPSKEERQNIKELRQNELAEKLYQVQIEKKCLVILDDIWKAEDWDKLRHAFPTAGKGRSRVLVTTRFRNIVVPDYSGGRLPHELNFLSVEDGWELLRRKAFPGAKNNPDFTVGEVKENLGKEIVEKCDGLPLAIVVLGGLLATKESVHDWERMNEDVPYFLQQSDGHNNILPKVLALSYNELPHKLKPCFLYLSHFPEDAAIPKKKLIQLWIAEGIVSLEQETDKVLEDVAEGHLVSLINRCMVQVADFGSTGRIKTCRLHDIMRDFCLLRAEKDNFLKLVRYSNGSDASFLSLPSGKTRRLAIYLPEDVDRFISSPRKQYSNLRSLLYFHGKRCRVEDWHLIKKILNLKILRVLDLEGVNGPYGQLPKEIGDLIQLQFLSLKKTYIGVLPPSIGNLIFLKTLNLQTISKFSRDSTVQIPNVIWKMTNLTHLYLPKWCGDMVNELKLSNLHRLQTLVNFPANKCDVKDLLKLTKLRKLVLNDPAHFKSLVAIFSPPNDVTLRCLQSLSFKSDTLAFPDEVVDVRPLLSSCSALQKFHVEGRIEKLPEYLHFPQNIAKLTLWGSDLVEDPIPILEKLPNLRILSGWQMFMGKKMVFSDQGFPKLRSLLLRGLKHFEDWMMEEGAMPSLYRLEISNCIKLKTIPAAVSSVKTLQELEICGCLFKIKEEDFYKVQHVPSVVIRN